MEDPAATPDEQGEASPPSPPSGAALTVPRVVVPRWLQAVLVPLAIVGLFELARAAGSVLVVLLFAIVLALILNPFVTRCARRMPRGLAIVLAYLLVVVLIGGIGLLLGDPIANQVGYFARHFPRIVRHANRDLIDLQNWLRARGIKVQIAGQGHTALQAVERRIERSSGSIVSFSRDLLGRAVTLSFDIVLAVVLSVYLLAYAAPIGRLVRRIMPPGSGAPADDYPRLVEKAVFGYVRGQLLFSVLMGLNCGLLLWLLGVVGAFPAGAKYAVFFGVFYGLMELIPYIGPIIGPIPPLIVALFTRPVTAIWLLIAFVLLQQLEGHVIAPQVFRISLRINPILVILALLIGYQLYGVAGALLALPIATIIRQTIVYLRDHLVLESWGTPPAPPAASTTGAPEVPVA